MEHVFINPTGTVSISVPVPRQTFDRIVVPKQGHRSDEYVIYDRSFIDMKVTGALTADQTNVARAFASKVYGPVE
eukprot:10705494-Lingulodinium_polyedra.AAC.1